MKNDTTFERIEAWLSGTLPKTEMKSFEAEMAADPALAAEVERHRRGREALDRLREQALQSDMATWRESLDEIPAPPTNAPNTSRYRNWMRWLLGGGLGLLLVGVVYWFWPSEQAPSDKDHNPETIPAPPNHQNIPIAVRPPDKPEKEADNPNQKPQKNYSRLIAMGESKLANLQGSIQNSYKNQRGDEENELPFFASGVKDFLKGDVVKAKEQLLQVPKDNGYFYSAREILAVIYLNEKEYHKAVECYEDFAGQSADPASDWRLLQFYLLDYQYYKVDFSKKLEEIIKPENGHRFQKEAEQLKRELKEMGIR